MAARLLVLRMLAVLVVGSGFASAPAEEREESEAAQIQIQVIEETSEKGGGVVFSLGGAPQYRLGLAVELEDGQLEVEQVLPESPAAKAGIKSGDVLLSFGDTKLTAVEEMQKLLQSSGGKPIALKILRKGEKIAVEVTPERDHGFQAILINEGGEAGKKGEKQAPLQLQQLHDQLRKQAAARKPAPTAWQMLKMPQTNHQVAIPDDLEVTIRKKGTGPARIQVKHDIQTWTLTEKELHKLPEPIRGHVARMLPGHAPEHLHGRLENKLPGTVMTFGNATPMNVGHAGFGFATSTVGTPNQPAGAAVLHITSGENSGDLQKEIQLLKRQLHELQEQVEALQKKTLNRTPRY